MYQTFRADEGVRTWEGDYSEDVRRTHRSYGRAFICPGLTAAVRHNTGRGIEIVTATMDDAGRVTTKREMKWSESC